MGKILMVVGVQGSGKTTILNEISKIDSKRKIVNIGSEILNAAKVKGQISNRDEIKYMSSFEILLARKAALASISNMDAQIILDTHAYVKGNSRYIPGFSLNEVEGLRELKAIIFIDAFAKDIIERRASDPSRKREAESEDEINEQRIINLSIITSFALHLNIPIYIIKNKKDKINESVNEFVKISKEVFGD
jgi:adenylate kinase